MKFKSKWGGIVYLGHKHCIACTLSCCWPCPCMTSPFYKEHREDYFQEFGKAWTWTFLPNTQLVKIAVKCSDNKITVFIWDQDSPMGQNSQQIPWGWRNWFAGHGDEVSTPKRETCEPKTHKTVQHSVEHIPPPGLTVYVLYPTDRPDLDLDLNQNLISLFLSPTQLTHQVSSESVNNFLRYRAIYRFGPISQWWKITEKIMVSANGSRSSPNLITSYLSHLQPVHQISSESILNFLRYHVSFKTHLSMVKNQLN